MALTRLWEGTRMPSHLVHEVCGGELYGFARQHLLMLLSWTALRRSVRASLHCLPTRPLHTHTHTLVHMVWRRRSTRCVRRPALTMCTSTRVCKTRRQYRTPACDEKTADGQPQPGRWEDALVATWGIDWSTPALSPTLWPTELCLHGCHTSWPTSSAESMSSLVTFKDGCLPRQSSTFGFAGLSSPLSASVG